MVRLAITPYTQPGSANGICVHAVEKFACGGEAVATQIVPKLLSIQDFVSELHQFPEAAFNHTSDILAFLERTTVAPESLVPYICWDRQHYTRNLIYKTHLYVLIPIFWKV